MNMLLFESSVSALARRQNLGGDGDVSFPKTPFGAGICRNIPVDHSSPVVPERHEDAKYAKRGGRQDEKVAGRNIWHVIIEKSRRV